MKFLVALAVLALAAYSGAVPAGVPAEPVLDDAPGPLVRLARAPVPAEKAPSAEKDLEGSESAYAVYPYYYHPYYLNYRYPYYIYGR